MLQTTPDPIHLILDIVTPIGMVAATVVGLMIKSAMSDAAAKHVEAAAQVKAELVASQVKTQSALDVHAARDEILFQGIKDDLIQGRAEFGQIKAKLDELNRMGERIDRTGAKA